MGSTMKTPREGMDIIQTDSTEEKDQRAPVKGGIDIEIAAPDKEEQEERKDLEEDMTIMKRTVGGILVRRDERLAQRP